MTLKFKNILFFSTKNEKTLFFKEKLETIQSVKIFKTSDVDEIQQIIDQSEKTVILVDDEISAAKLFKATLNKTKARFKLFYISWDMLMDKNIREEVIEEHFTLIHPQDIDSAIERLELYFFGRVNMLTNPDPVEEKKDQFKKGYFTHLEKNGDKWRILISSHESDDEINKILGKNWNRYLNILMDEAKHLTDIFEKKLETAPYHEVIFPHLENGKLKKLSIVHLKLDTNFVENIVGIHKFLRELK